MIVVLVFCLIGVKGMRQQEIRDSIPVFPAGCKAPALWRIHGKIQTQLLLLGYLADGIYHANVVYPARKPRIIGIGKEHLAVVSEGEADYLDQHMTQFAEVFLRVHAGYNDELKASVALSPVTAASKIIA